MPVQTRPTAWTVLFFPTGDSQFLLCPNTSKNSDLKYCSLIDYHRSNVAATDFTQVTHVFPVMKSLKRVSNSTPTLNLRGQKLSEYRLRAASNFSKVPLLLRQPIPFLPVGCILCLIQTSPVVFICYCPNTAVLLASCPSYLSFIRAFAPLPQSD